MPALTDKKPTTAKFAPKGTATVQAERQLCVARFSPDGTTLFAGGYDSHVHRWDCTADKPKALAPWENGGGWVQCLEFSRDGKIVFTADSWGALQAWNPAGEKPRAIWSNKAAHDGWIHGLAVSPDGQWLATTGIDGAVRVWSAKNGKRKHALIENGPETFAVAFHPDGKSLVSGDLYGVVSQWDITTGKKAREFDARALFKEHRLQEVGGARTFAFDTTGGRLFVGGTQPKNGGNVQGVPTVLVFDWKTGKLEKTLELGKTSDVYVCEVAWHSAGFVMAAISGNPGAGKIVLQNLADEKPFFETTKYRNCHSLCLHPSGKRFAVTSTNNGSNGNGRRLKDGEYPGNYSPVHIFDFPTPS